MNCLTTIDTFRIRLRRPDAFAITHTDAEKLLDSEGREILRQMFQDALLVVDKCFEKPL